MHYRIAQGGGGARDQGDGSRPDRSPELIAVDHLAPHEGGAEPIGSAPDGLF